jgi:5-methyltetrahydrofolate--homocysteine methyltransferase
MVTVAEEMKRAEMTMPLLIGGATTSRVHTALRIDPAYQGAVVHVLDASRAVGVCTQLVSDSQAIDFVARTKADYEEVRVKRANAGGSNLVPLEKARENAFVADMALKPRAPVQPGVHRYDDWGLEDLRALIDWTPFFRSWELAGNYPAILDDKVVGESARSLFADAQEMLEKIVAEKWLTARGVVGLWPAHRHGDDVFVQHRHSDDHRSPDGGSVPEHIRVPDLDRSNEGSRRLCFLRQQVAKREGRANMCLADFIDPRGDWLGGFAVAIHGIDPHLARFKAETDDYNDILLKALADRFAEAFAERLHQHVRTTLWGYAPDEQLTSEALIREQYRGIRPAPGYPACPDHTLKPELFEMLSDGTGDVAGITLTESMAMLPTAAVSGFYFGHPDAAYFGVAQIGQDQVADYATRRGQPKDQVERWLRPNLS